MKKHGEQNVKHKFTQTCATEREDLTRLKENAVITSIQCLVSCQPVLYFNSVDVDSVVYVHIWYFLIW